MTIAAVIFDCDGVLVDSESIAIEAETVLLAAIGLHYETADFVARFMGMSDRAFYAALDADSRALLGRPLPADFRARVDARKRALNAEKLRAVPGAAHAVMRLALRKAVASSSEAGHLDYKLRKTGLLHHFAPHVYSADHVEHAKPAPDLFLHAAANIAVAPRHCLVVEDSVNGVLAARAAGMRVWGFAGGAHMTDACRPNLLAAGAERIVENWDAFAL
ncbi:MAG: HAD-IA family hydrolase [Alphaproteobacteria bacterium]|nr:HAD-IA family hydrolase [Alphaproteobacteria bacterium]MBV9692899.1 HAD-IA family hydrolase [Alphaproteobacteria bacterium]